MRNDDQDPQATAGTVVLTDAQGRTAVVGELVSMDVKHEPRPAARFAEAMYALGDAADTATCAMHNLHVNWDNLNEIMDRAAGWLPTPAPVLCGPWVRWVALQYALGPFGPVYR